jgi:folylpolyglutamate synthase/dihydropteroate synthase
MMKRKDIMGFLEPLKGCLANIITVTIPQPEAWAADDLAATILKAGVMQVSAGGTLPEVADVLGQCGDGALLIAGSLYLVGEILKNHG